MLINRLATPELIKVYGIDKLAPDISIGQHVVAGYIEKGYSLQSVIKELHKTLNA